MGAPAELALGGPEEDALGRADLSTWFNPFLAYFARDTRRCGGEVRLLRDAGEVNGLVIADAAERVATVFTRSSELAATTVRDRGSLGMFAEFPAEPAADPFDVFERLLGEETPTFRFGHAVRALVPEDLPTVRALMREVYRFVNDRWFVGLPNRSETGFVAEVEGRLAGVGWVTLVGPHARLHSLTVRVPFRRMGLGSDLVRARVWWAQRNGARRVVSEIARGNTDSQAIAERVGMQRVGTIYFHRAR